MAPRAAADLPNELLIQLYQSIVTNEIKLEQREFISSVQEGWLLKQGGRIKTWKKRCTTPQPTTPQHHQHGAAAHTPHRPTRPDRLSTRLPAAAGTRSSRAT